MNTKEKIGRNMLLARKQKKYSQERIANELDMSPYYYRQIEHSKANPTIEMLIRIADGFGIKVDELFKDE